MTGRTAFRTGYRSVFSGAVSDQPLSLTDVMATCATVVDEKLPNDAAEDSFDVLPLFLGRQGDAPIRPYL